MKIGILKNAFAQQVEQGHYTDIPTRSQTELWRFPRSATVQGIGGSSSLRVEEVWAEGGFDSFATDVRAAKACLLKKQRRSESKKTNDDIARVRTFGVYLLRSASAK